MPLARTIAAAAVIGLAAVPSRAGGQPASGLPLTAARTVAFTTSEGTWMSVDVAPDGRTVVFDLLGDIYTIPITGGAATPRLTGAAFQSQPRYSPDGRQLVFISDADGADNVWVVDPAGGNPRRISTERAAAMVSPAWWPDGRSIVVSVTTPERFGASELWRYDLATGNREIIGERTRTTPSLFVSAPPPGAFGPAPTKDGRAVYYAEIEPRQYRSTSPARATVMRLDLATNRSDRLSPSAGGMKPVLSPDGQSLAYAEPREGSTGLKLRDLETGEERWILFPFQRDELEARATRDVLPNFAFTPDGRSLILAAGGRIRRLDVATGELSEVPFSAPVRLDLGPSLDFPRPIDQGPVRARVLQGPAIAPDGRRLAFSTFGELYLLDSPNSAPRRATDAVSAREFDPAFSPDGQWLAFVTWTSRGGQLWRVRVDRSAPPERLTTDSAFYAQPLWSADGGRLFALRATRQARLESTGAIPSIDGHLVALPATGGAPTRVAAVRGMTRPHLRGDRIYGTVSGEGLVSFRPDGSDRRVHLQVISSSRRGLVSPAEDIRMSPTDESVLALVGQQLYWIPLPVPSGRVDLAADSSRAVRLSPLGADGFGWSPDGREAWWNLGATVYRRAVPGDGTEPGPLAAMPVVIEKPRATPTGRVVLRGGTVITMRGAEVIRDADVTVVGNRITAIGRRGSGRVAPGTHLVDVTGKFMIPGFVDIHAHWDLRRGILDTENSAALANLAFGVTTIRDPQSFTPDIFAYADLIETGEMVGPRVVSTGPGLMMVEIQSLAEARAVVARFRDHYRTHLLKAYLNGNRQQRQWLAQAAAEGRMIPTAEGGSDFKLDLTHALDGFGNEHALPTAPIFADVVQLIARSGISYTPTLLVAFGGPFAQYDFLTREDPLADPKLARFIPRATLAARVTGQQAWYHPLDYHYPTVAAGAAAILRAGGRVALGSHGELEGLGAHWELRALAKGGLTNHELLQVATIHGARAIGHGQDLGSLEPGKLADLVVLDRNPLADIRHAAAIRFVMKNGVLYRGATLDEVWPRPRALPVPWWRRERP